jgi:hypothetical protein
MFHEAGIDQRLQFRCGSLGVHLSRTEGSRAGKSSPCELRFVVFTSLLQA